MNQRITLNEVASRLAYKDKRAAEIWCKDKGVTIICERRHKFVFEIEFEFAVEKDFFDGFKKKYPNNYREIYTALKNDDKIGAYELASNQNLTQISISKSTYVPKSDHSTRIMNRFAS